MLKDIDQKATWEGQGLFQFITLSPHPLLQGVRAGTQHRNLEAGTEAKAVAICCLLTDLLLWLSYST